MSATAPTARSRLSAPAWLRKLWLLLAESVVAILLALVVGGIGIAAFSGLLPNHSSFDLGLPIAAYGALWSGAVGSTNGITSTLVYSTPLILAGLGVGLGFKAGLFNIGGRGQFLMGTVGAMSVVTLIGSSTPGYITIPLALIVGAVLGGFAGFIPGVLKATSGAHEVVTTIMLNYILVFTTYWAISGPLRLPNSPQPITVDVTTRNGALPIVLGRDGHIGILFALLAVPLVWFLLYRTTLGFELRTAGANSDAARYDGMKTRQLIVLAMTLAGALCGLAGATTLLGVVHQIAPGYDTTIGFDAITVALLGRSNPVGIMLSGLLLGGMRAGAQSMQISPGVPAELVDAMQAIILLFLLVNVLRRWRARRAPGGSAPASADSTEIAPAFGMVAK
ncbi:MAG: ABC transporter permease [Candidatus Limnocylindrales bacterium]